MQQTKQGRVPMNVSLPLTHARSRAGVADSVEIPQYSRSAIVAIWAAAALPMAAAAWLVTPVLADRFGGDGIVPMAKALYVSLTVALVWQFVLVAVLVRREQGTLRWSTVREALWLRSPRSPRSGRRGGRVWLVLIPLIVLFGAAHELIPTLAAPENRDFATLVESDARTGWRTACSSPAITCMCRGRCPRRWSTRSPSRTRPSASEAPGSALRC